MSFNIRQQRELVIGINPYSSRFKDARPVIAWLQAEVPHADVIETYADHQRTRSEWARMIAGKVFVIVGGDATVTDGIESSIIANMEAAPDELAIPFFMSAGGENDTANDMHGGLSMHELARAAAIACHRDRVPTRALRPFVYSINRGRTGVGAGSAAVGMVASAVPWFEAVAKAELNNQGRSLQNKIDTAVRYFQEEGVHYRMPRGKRNGVHITDDISTFLIMNNGRMAGSWYNWRSRGASNSPWFVVEGVNASDFPSAMIFGARALTGQIGGEKTSKQVFHFDKPVDVQVDGEHVGQGTVVEFSKGDASPRVEVGDACTILLAA